VRGSYLSPNEAHHQYALLMKFYRYTVPFKIYLNMIVSKWQAVYCNIVLAQVCMAGNECMTRSMLDRRRCEGEVYLRCTLGVPHIVSVERVGKFCDKMHLKNY
jgi:hypothetical protein